MPEPMQEADLALGAAAEIDPALRDRIEAAAFRKLVQHLRQRTDVQNIDMMNLAGFCRNCLSRWYREAAEDRSLPLTKDEAREVVYGMPYAESQERYQTEASPEAKEAFARGGAHATKDSS